tara:strand:- start:11 stop:241 length:231 start_codon:yes stop_codon:yes gene_type:complete
VEQFSASQIGDFWIQSRCNHAPEMVPINGDSTMLDGTQLDFDPCSLQDEKSLVCPLDLHAAGIGLRNLSITKVIHA